MAVTTQLLGKLGGTPETQTVEISGSVQVPLPTGWKRAVGVFNGKNNGTYCWIFNLRHEYAQYFLEINGGGVVSAGETANFSNVEGILIWYRLE